MRTRPVDRPRKHVLTGAGLAADHDRDPAVDEPPKPADFCTEHRIVARDVGQRQITASGERVHLDLQRHHDRLRPNGCTGHRVERRAAEPDRRRPVPGTQNIFERQTQDSIQGVSNQGASQRFGASYGRRRSRPLPGRRRRSRAGPHARSQQARRKTSGRRSSIAAAATGRACPRCGARPTPADVRPQPCGAPARD